MASFCSWSCTNQPKSARKGTRIPTPSQSLEQTVLAQSSRRSLEIIVKHLYVARHRFASSSRRKQQRSRPQLPCTNSPTKLLRKWLWRKDQKRSRLIAEASVSQALLYSESQKSLTGQRNHRNQTHEHFTRCLEHSLW